MTRGEEEEAEEKGEQLERKAWEVGKLGERAFENAVDAISPALEEFANAAA